MKKLIIIDSTHDYDYSFDNQTHTLFYSQGDQWNEHTKGTIAMSITDEGDEIVIGGKKIKKLDCMQALYLTILLKIIHSDYKFEMAEKIEF